MATISSIGIGSGLDINSIITKLVAIEQVPLNKLKTEATSLQTKLTTYGKVQSYLSALREASSALTRTDTWGATTGTSSDPTAVAVTTSATTKTGNYSLSVQSLAASQSNVAVYSKSLPRSMLLGWISGPPAGFRPCSVTAS